MYIYFFKICITLFTMAKIWKEPKCPLTEEWIKKMCVCVCVCAYTHAQWNITQP